MGFLEGNIAAPDEAANIINSSFGGGAKTVFGGISGIGTRDAARLAQGVKGGTTVDVKGRVSQTALVEQLAVSGAIAKGQARAVGAARDDALMVTLLEITAGMRESLIGASKNDAVMVELTGLIGDLGKFLDNSSVKLNSGIQKIMNLFP